MATENQYRAFVGRIQFPPRDGNAGGKEVRNITIRTTGGGEQSIKVGATLWPSHGHIEVEEGDVVYVEGKFTRTKGEGKDGTPVTYNNLSVSDIRNFGAADGGKNESEAASSAAAPETDDEIPF